MRSGGTTRRIGTCIAALALVSAVAPEETAAQAEETAAGAEKDAPGEQADVRGLMNYSLALARQLLGEYPSFHPFAFVIEKNGQIGQVALTEGRDHEGTVLLEALREILQARAAEGRYRAVAIAADVHISHSGKDTDAIQVGLEHAEGYCVNVYLPYERSDAGEVTVGEAVSAAREGAVFGPCRETASD